MLFSDGSKYEGGWLNNKEHGEGVLMNSDGSIRKGIWMHG
jgi:hypothetical protein